MDREIIIHWFRQDLRLEDNPALTEAASRSLVLPLYILDLKNDTSHPLGAASRWWLHHSLTALNESLQGKLFLTAGDPLEVLEKLIKTYTVTGVYWNRCYEPWRIKRDAKILSILGKAGLDVKSFNGSLLWEPWEVLKPDGTPYKVFTPYYRNRCLNTAPPRTPLPKPRKIRLVEPGRNVFDIDRLKLLPEIRWDMQLEPHWRIGEKAAHRQINKFISTALNHYKQNRNFPARPYVSRLSPHLHFGELSPNQAWYAVRSEGDDENVSTYCSELGWREFSYYLLYHFPALPCDNWNKKFDGFPWKKNSGHLKAWQQGMTGYPIIDAGMRELWQTGYVHNRVRMIAGSFLVKNLLQDWRKGEKWFRDCLVDADLANNSAGWQWVAGCGADAAPYFRIFNPVTQGQKFDPGGEYTLRYVPELKNLPTKYLFSPWEAPKQVLEEAGIKLGDDYPGPVVDLKDSRTRALDAFKSIKISG